MTLKEAIADYIRTQENESHALVTLADVKNSSELAAKMDKWDEWAFRAGYLAAIEECLAQLRSQECRHNFSTDNYFSETEWGPKIADWLEKKLKDGGTGE